MSLNRAMVIGNLGGDPVLRNLPSGQPAVGFSIATDESFTDKEGQKQERVEWHQIVAFGKLAETCNRVPEEGTAGLRRRDGSARASSKPRTTAASASAPRSSRRACSFSGAPPAEKTEAAPSKSLRRRPMKCRSELAFCVTLMSAYWPDRNGGVVQSYVNHVQ